MQLATPILYTLPRRVWVVSELVPLFGPWFRRWNECGGRELFRMLGDESQCDCFVVRDPVRTWVDMPITSPRAVLHWGPEPASREYWAGHEPGHLLGLADEVWAGMDVTGYHNPVVVGDGEGFEDSVMSYLSPPAKWFGAADRAHLRELFPLEVRAHIPNVAGGGGG